MAELEVELLPALSDNYIYLLWEPSSGTSGVVDPATAAPVLARLGQLGRKLDWVLITHHHADHIGGLAELKEATGCTAIGPRADAARIPGLDRHGGGRRHFPVRHVAGRPCWPRLATPAGTSATGFPKLEALFCGDTLFALGCGRLFEGDAATMWRSLGKLMALPDATRVYCGHEYTLSNAHFAVGLEPDNQALAQRAAEVEATRARGEPTIPSTIGLEKATSPFLRAADPALRQQLGLEGASDVEVFAEVRRRKDRA